MRIVTHNAFWFQGAPFATDRPGPADPAILAALAGVYRELAPDLLAVQEVQDPGTFERLAEAIGLGGRHCPGGELVQYGGAMLSRAGRLVADWRSAALRPQRMWQIVDVPAGGGADLRVCSVHLPSARQLGGPAAQARRVEELRAALAQADGAAVVLGDFNEPPGGPVDELLAGQGYVDAAVAAGQADRPTGPGGGRGDRVWICQPSGAELIDYGVVDGRRLRAPMGPKEWLSDHFPAWVRLRVNAGGTGRRAGRGC